MWTPQAKAIFALMRRVWMCTCAIALHSCLDMNGVSTDIIYLKSNRSAHKFSLWGKKMCLKNSIQTTLKPNCKENWVYGGCTCNPILDKGKVLEATITRKINLTDFSGQTFSHHRNAVIRSKFSETKGNLLTRKVVVFLNLYSKW